MPDTDQERVTPDELDRWHDRFDTWGAVAGPPPLRRAAATIRALTAERDEARTLAATYHAAAARAVPAAEDLLRQRDAARAELADAQAIVRARQAISEWGWWWEEILTAGSVFLRAWPLPTPDAPIDSAAYTCTVEAPDDRAEAWRKVAAEVIEQAAAPYRARVEAAGCALLLRCGEEHCKPVTVALPDGAGWHYEGTSGDYPTRDDCEAAAQWAEAQADAQAAGPPDADDDADLTRKLDAATELAERLKLPMRLWDAMRRRMTAGHREHAGQDLWGLDLRAEARGEAVDGCNYTAALSDPTPDDLRAAALFAEAWALLGGEAARGEREGGGDGR